MSKLNRIQATVRGVARFGRVASSKAVSNIKQYWPVHLLLVWVLILAAGLWYFLSVPRQRVAVSTRQLPAMDLAGDAFVAGFVLHGETPAYVASSSVDSVVLSLKKQESLVCVPQVVNGELYTQPEIDSLVQGLLSVSGGLPRYLIEAGLELPLVRLDEGTNITLLPDSAADGFSGKLYWPKGTTIGSDEAIVSRLITSGGSFNALGFRNTNLALRFSQSDAIGRGFGLASYTFEAKGKWCDDEIVAIAPAGVDSLLIYLSHTTDSPSTPRLGQFRINTSDDSLPVVLSLGAHGFSHAHLTITDSAFVSVGGEGPQVPEPFTQPYFAELRDFRDSSSIRASDVEQAGFERGRFNAVELGGYPEHVVVAGTQYGPQRRMDEGSPLPFGTFLLVMAGMFAAIVNALAKLG